MKEYLFYRIFALCLLFFSVCIGNINAQPVELCGDSGPFIRPSDRDTSQWNFTFYDYYGNSYVLEDLAFGSSSSSDCADSGIFDLSFLGNFTASEIETICQVFSDLSDQITSVQSNIPINVTKEDLGDILGTATSFIPVSNTIGGCGVESNLIWGAINTNVSYNDMFPTGFALGLLKINEVVPNGNNWHTLDEDLNSSTPNVQSNEYDLYTAVLHECLHLLGIGSRIAMDGSPINGVYSRWDKFLYGKPDNSFLINPSSNGECCDFHEFNSTDYPNLPDDVINSCSGSPSFPDIVFNMTNVATVNAEYGYPSSNSEFQNILSHLDKDCDGELYVMHYNLNTGEHRRVITGPEETILCYLGYNFQVSGTTCGSCTIEASDDGIFETTSHFIYIEEQDLLSNDIVPSGYSIEIDLTCGDAPYLTIDQDVNGNWTISSLTPGVSYTLCYHLTGCNGECDQGYIHIFRVPDFPILPPCPPNVDCQNENLFCYGGCEDFVPPIYCNLQPFGIPRIFIGEFSVFII